MATARRVFWETVIVIGFLLVIGGTILVSEKRIEIREARLHSEHEKTIESRDAERTRELEALRAVAKKRVLDQAESEAEAVLEAFVAASRTAIEARWGNYLARATGALAAQPKVVFVRIVSTDGRTLAGSGEGGPPARRLEPGDWVLTAEGLEKRRGETEDVLELTAPIQTAGRTVAHLWIGYDLAAAIGEPPP